MMSPFIHMIPLLAGYLLDLLFGDPEKLPHPVRLFGFMIRKGEALLNPPRAYLSDDPSGRLLLFLKGTALTLVLCTAVFSSTYFLLHALDTLNPVMGIIAASLGVYYGLANRQLIIEGRLVFAVLRDTRDEKDCLEKARRCLSRIVGRDTDALGPQQIRIAVLETLSENLSDGVIAPLFYYALAGLPGMLTYKMINTLDSMIGYRNKRFAQFGKFAARLDDAVNFIPARLTALLMILVSASPRGLSFIIRYGHQHKSPNAGYPEAALAGIMDIRFGGPNRYGGQWVEKPFIGHNDRTVGAGEIRKASAINQRCCALMVAIMSSLIFIIHHKSS